MEFYVSRQRQFPDGDLVVEVNTGGLNYANPGMLGERFKSLGEGQTFYNPREAVEAAINIANEWRKSETDPVYVASGSTGGMTMPFSPMTEEEITKWADELYEKLPKCAQCNEVLGKVTYTHELAMDGEKFCREYCCEKNYNSYHNSEECDDDEQSA